ncbi:hypothetical protein BDF14DRAFT_1836902 [Spinellus fusiger]|nr:hypothetical protein BDF14DRAFT_1836902 [Spinellus fusiger]
MPSDKKKITNTGKSAHHTLNDFVGAFAVTSSHPFGISFSSDMSPLEESDLANNDKRSAHNALERQRREGLNTKFQQLAHVLPSLQTVRRPSKTMIVTKSLEYVSTSVQRETTFQKQLRVLREENEKLRKQAHRSILFLKKKNGSEPSSSQNKRSTDKKIVTNMASNNNSKTSKKVPSPIPSSDSYRVVKKKSSHSLLKKFTSKLQSQQLSISKKKQEKIEPSSHGQTYPHRMNAISANACFLTSPVTATMTPATTTPSSSPSYFSTSTISPLPPLPSLPPPLFDPPYSSPTHSVYPLSDIPRLMPQLDAWSPLDQVWSTEDALYQSVHTFDHSNVNTSSYLNETPMAQAICNTDTPLQTPAPTPVSTLPVYGVDSCYLFDESFPDPFFSMNGQMMTIDMPMVDSTYVDSVDLSPIFLQNTSNNYTYM